MAKTIIWLEYNYMSPNDQYESTKHLIEVTKGMFDEPTIIIATYGGCKVHVLRGSLAHIKWSFISTINKIKCFLKISKNNSF